MDSTRIACGHSCGDAGTRWVYQLPAHLSPAKGQNAAQQDFDARECDHQVHSAGRSMLIGWATAWSDKERDAYVACMQAKGYTSAQK